MTQKTEKVDDECHKIWLQHSRGKHKRSSIYPGEDFWRLVLADIQHNVNCTRRQNGQKSILPGWIRVFPSKCIWRHIKQRNLASFVHFEDQNFFFGCKLHYNLKASSAFIFHRNPMIEKTKKVRFNPKFTNMKSLMGNLRLGGR